LRESRPETLRCGGPILKHIPFEPHFLFEVGRNRPMIGEMMRLTASWGNKCGPVGN
jgi:hypothetical protein